MTSTMDKVKAEVKHALHMDKDNTSTTTGTTHHNTTGTTGAGANTGVAEGTAGPHDSRLANAADPRVDSDLDSTRNTGANNTYTGTGAGVTGGTGQVREGTAGPHNSRLGNAVDPRVDSDLDSSRTTTGGYSGAGAGTGTGVGATGTTGATGATTGPHSSNLLNKADPRVDSDADGSRNMGAATYGPGGSNTGNSGTAEGNTGIVGGGTGTTGGISHSTNAGPHDSNLANKLDPRVDSDLDGSGNRVGANKGGVFGASGSHATAGSGTAQNTAGPHNSDLANKVDPRVDSDRDGSGTFGGNLTHA